MKTYVFAHNTVYEEDHHALNRVEQTKEPLDNFRRNVVANDKETQSPSDAKDWKEDEGRMEESTAAI